MGALLRLLAACGLAFALLLPAAADAPAQDRQAPDIEAATWVLVDARSGDRLTGESAEQRRPIASATKLMTAWVALRRLELHQVVRAVDYPALPVESVIGLAGGELVSVRDLIDGLIIASGNDAAVTLAVAAAGSVPAFVAQMNAEARRMGLEDSRFTNPIGLDDPGSYSSAADLAELSRHLMRMPSFSRVAASTEATLRSLDPPRRIVTRNTLLYELPWADGIKTGQTVNAGYVLVGSGSRAGVRLISVVLGADSMMSRDAESRQLLEYGMSLYRVREPVARGEVMASAEIKYFGGRLGLRADRSLRLALRAGERPRTVIRAPKEVEGPISRGEPLGVVRVLVDGRPRGGARLLAGRDLPRAGAIRRLVTSPWAVSALVLGGLFVILIGSDMIRRRRGRRGGEDSNQSSEGNSQGVGRERNRRELK